MKCSISHLLCTRSLDFVPEVYSNLLICLVYFSDDDVEGIF